EILSLLAFDYCTLVLPESDGHGVRVWRASRMTNADRTTASEEPIGEAKRLLASVLQHGSARVIDEGELPPTTKDFCDDGKSALALPLSFGGKCFGLLCFASTEANAYTKDDSERLMWFADHVAAAAQSIILRARLDSMNENMLEMERLKSGFVNTLVRDIRLPLPSVLGLLELSE